MRKGTPLFETSSSSEGSSMEPPTSEIHRRACCFTKLAGTQVDVIVRDGAHFKGILSVHGNGSLYPQTWGDLPLTQEELANAQRYVRGQVAAEDGWRTIAKKSKKRDDGKLDKYNAASGEFCLWLRAAQRRPGPNSLSGPVVDLLGISWKDVQAISGVVVDENARERDFQTDTQITKPSGEARERILERWADDGDANSQETRLTDWPANVGEDNNSQEGWNQFEENNRMFGVKTTYVEEYYTTHLNVSQIPEAFQRKAAELAESMNNGRGRFKDEDEEERDEEKKFAAVNGPYRKMPRNQIKRIEKHEKPAPPPPEPDHKKDACRSPHVKAPYFHPVERRLPKDNINALNLEPIKSDKRLSKIARNDPRMPSRQKALEDFSQSAILIQRMMEKKGWTTTSSSTSATESHTRDEKVPPLAAKVEPPKPEEEVTRARVNKPMPKEEQPPYGHFQFNPNANSFTPKGEPRVKSNGDELPIAAALAAMDDIFQHSQLPLYVAPCWAPKLHVSYVECLSQPVIPMNSYGPYFIPSGGPMPPMVQPADTQIYPMELLPKSPDGQPVIAHPANAYPWSGYIYVRPPDESWNPYNRMNPYPE